MKVTIILLLVLSPKDWFKDWMTYNNGTGGDCHNYSIIEISQYTEKSPGDLRRLAATKTPVKTISVS